MIRRIAPLIIAACMLGSAAPPPGGEGRVVTVGPWHAPDGLEQLPIWPGAAPDADPSVPPESVLTVQNPDAIGGHPSQAVFDVSVPTMTVYPPKGASKHAAVIVFPGGGFSADVVTLEGTEICDWLSAKGLTCVILTYRVPGTAHYWNAACKCHVTPKVPRALQDAQRAIRLVRSRAAELKIDPDKIGVIGFSAGGYLVAEASNIVERAYKPIDAVDRVSSRPDFALALYPGHLCRPGKKFDPGLQVTKAAPPTFIVQAWDDPVDNICNSILYARALDEAGVPTEVHLFSKGGHAFALRHPTQPIGSWATLAERWLAQIGIL
jgi:acetyl esterase/lipase